MAYTLADPISDVQLITQIGGDPISEGVSTSGYRMIWKDGSDVHHMLATFGGYNNAIWHGVYVNLTDPDTAILITGPMGAVWPGAYSSYHNKLYVGTGYAGSLSELDLTQSPPVFSIIDDTRPNFIYLTIATGDDNRIYYMDYYTSKTVHSYDPSVGLPSGWRAFPTLTNSSGDNIGYVDADSDYVYCAFKRLDGTHTLFSSPVTGTLTWTPWEFDAAGDTSVYMARDTNGNIFVQRTLSNATNKWYYLANGTHGEEVSQPTQGSKIGPPLYSLALSDESEYGQFNDYYGYDVDFGDLFPIKTIHEWTSVGYKLHADSSFTYTDPIVYSGGQFVSQAVKYVMPKTGNNLFVLSHDYTAAIDLNYGTPSRSYIGGEILAPYALEKHPISGEYYSGGYSNFVWRYDPEAEWTLTNSTTAPATPGTTPYPDVGTPNPFRISLPSPLLHYRYRIDFDYNGLVWIGGNTIRLSPNYGDVIWYDPSNGDTGSMFSAIWGTTIPFKDMCSCLNRTKILVSNSNDRIYKIDANSQSIDTYIDTGYGDTSNSFLIEVAYDKVMVVGTLGTVGKIGMLKPSTMTWDISLQDITGVSGTLFGFDGTQYIRMYRRLRLGPDGFVWLFVGDSLYRVDPDDPTLELQLVVDTDYAMITFANNGTDLIFHYIHGNSDGSNSECKNLAYISGIFTYTADYSRGSYISLPTGDADLDTPYTGDDITDVATDDTDMVPQLATSQIAIHQFKQQMNGIGGIINVVAQVTIPCSTSTAYLQIYNRSGTPAWDTIDSDNATGANTDFTLSATVADLTDYKGENNIVACRVYQEMQ